MFGASQQIFRPFLFFQVWYHTDGMIYIFSAMNELLFENYMVPKVTYGIDGLFSLYKNQPNFAKDKSTAMVISLGTIHILRKHF